MRRLLNLPPRAGCRGMQAVLRVLRDHDDTAPAGEAPLLTIEEVADRAQVSFSTAYVSLQDLEQTRWVTCHMGWGAGSRRKQSYKLTPAGRASIPTRFGQRLDGKTGTQIPHLTSTARKAFTHLRTGEPMSAAELAPRVSQPTEPISRSAVFNTLRSWPAAAVTCALDDHSAARRPPYLWVLTDRAMNEGFPALVTDPAARQVLAEVEISPVSTEMLAERLPSLPTGLLRRLLGRLSTAQFVTDCQVLGLWRLTYDHEDT